jgi:hypothetical protein
MSLLVLAYPRLSDEDLDTIQQFRRKHDGRYYDVVGPHFALVYPVTDMDQDTFRAEVRARIGTTGPIRFTLRYAAINKDAFEDLYHVFLIPEEGAGRLVRLHDRLYGGALFPRRRLDIDYIPHIGVANSPEASRCLALVEEWNAGEFAVPGTVSTLDVVRYENGTVTTIDQIALLP